MLMLMFKKIYNFTLKTLVYLNSYFSQVSQTGTESLELNIVRKTICVLLLFPDHPYRSVVAKW